MHFVGITNQYYALGMVALLKSILTVNPESEFTILQFRSNILDESALKVFKRLGANILVIDDYPIRIIKDKSRNGEFDRYGLEAFARILVQDYFDEPVVWVDTDIIAKRAFTEGVTMPHASTLLAAQKINLSLCELFKNLDYKTKRLLESEISANFRMEEHKGVNTGVLWLNPSSLRKSDFQAQFFCLLEKFNWVIKNGDESIISLLFHKYPVEFLPDHVQEFKGYEIVQPYTSKHQPLFYHYQGKLKPWMIGYPDLIAVTEYQALLGSSLITKAMNIQ